MKVLVVELKLAYIAAIMFSGSLLHELGVPRPYTTGLVVWVTGHGSMVHLAEAASSRRFEMALPGHDSWGKAATLA